MPTMKELLNKTNFVASRYSNSGYAREQESEKEYVKKRVLEGLKTAFPDISKDLGVRDYQGLGIYSCYSDFSITYRDEKLIGVGTHSSTIQRKYYRAEYDFDVPNMENKENLDSLSPAMVVSHIKDYYYEQKKNGILKEIEKKKEEIKDLEIDLNNLNKDNVVKNVKINFFTWSSYGPQGSMLVESNGFSNGDYIDTCKDVEKMFRNGYYMEEGKTFVHKDYKFSPLTRVEFAFADDDSAIHRFPFALGDVKTQSFVDQFEQFGDKIDNTVVGLGLRNQFEECIKLLKVVERNMENKNKYSEKEVTNLIPDEKEKSNTLGRR